MRQSTESSESTSTKKTRGVEHRLAEVLKDHRRGLTHLEQAKSIIKALPDQGLRIQES